MIYAVPLFGIRRLPASLGRDDIMTPRLWIPLLLGIALFAAGCASQGQRLDLAPAAALGAGPDGDDRSVALQVDAVRSDAELGYLLNVRGEAAPLESVRPPAEVGRAAVVDALEGRGFRVVEADTEARLRLTVTVDELQHTVSAGVSRVVETRVALRSEVVRGDDRLRGRAALGDRQRISYRPDAEENAAWIDATLERAIERLLNEELLAFLRDD